MLTSQIFREIVCGIYVKITKKSKNFIKFEIEAINQLKYIFILNLIKIKIKI